MAVQATVISVPLQFNSTPGSYPEPGTSLISPDSVKLQAELDRVVGVLEAAGHEVLGITALQSGYNQIGRGLGDVVGYSYTTNLVVMSSGPASVEEVKPVRTESTAEPKPRSSPKGLSERTRRLQGAQESQ